MSTTDNSAPPERRKGGLVKSATLATRSLLVTVSHDQSVRRTVIGLLLLLPVVVWLPIQRLEQLVLVLSMMLVLRYRAKTVSMLLE